MINTMKELILIYNVLINTFHVNKSVNAPSINMAMKHSTKGAIFQLHGAVFKGA